jgi:hypothetical protein
MIKRISRYGRQAFTAAASLPALQAHAVKESLPLSFIGGSTVAGQVGTPLADSGSIAQYVH